MSRLARLFAASLLAVWAEGAPAQDFTSPGTSGPSASPLAFLERGLSRNAGGARLDLAATRWFGLSDLVTRAVALGLGWRSLRVAAGVSQTGDRGLGWSAAGLACGVAHPAGGAALRTVARRDREPDDEGYAPERLTDGSPEDAGASGVPAGVGIEAGGGAWVTAGPRLTLWASAPQLWAGGGTPPLPRALEIGGSLAADEILVWLARSAPVRTGAGAGRLAAGAALASGPWTIWLEARDRPLRGTIGVTAVAGRLRASAAIEGHPVLEETVKISLGLSAGRGAP